MKKLFLITAIAVFGISYVNAQESVTKQENVIKTNIAQGFSAGLNLGLPVSEERNEVTFNISVDVNYLWSVSDKISLGVASGYSHSFVGEDKGDDWSYIPIAVAGRYLVSEKFIAGADVGFGYSISSNDEDYGFYWSPRVQYQINETFDIVSGWRTITGEDGNFSVITLGIEFEL